MSVFALQLTAMIAMLCDHIGFSFLDNPLLLRCIGRFAFPIYAFLLAEGFRHMRGKPAKLEQHLAGLVLLALVSEVGYDMLEVGTLVIDDLISNQNAIFTLLLGFLGMMAIDRWKVKPVYMWSAIVLTAIANYIFMSNYKFVGVLLVYGFLWYLDHMEGKGYASRFLCLLLIFLAYLPIYHWARFGFCDWAVYVEKLNGTSKWWYLTHIPVAALLAAYKGQLGFYSKKFKLVYRWFYPVHLLILGIIKRFVL